MPFIKAFSTTRCGCVLGDKNSMTPHRRLSAVISRLCWYETFFNKITGMTFNYFDAFCLIYAISLSVSLNRERNLDFAKRTKRVSKLSSTIFILDF